MPNNYLSGTTLSDTATYLNKTFVTLGINPGTYLYTYGPSTDTITVRVVAPVAAVPEPAALGLLGLGVVALFAARRRRPGRRA